MRTAAGLETGTVLDGLAAPLTVAEYDAEAVAAAGLIFAGTFDPVSVAAAFALLASPATCCPSQENPLLVCLAAYWLMRWRT